MPYGEELAFAAELVRRAASAYHAKDPCARTKENGMGVYDVVTDLDVGTEEIIRGAIRERYPDDGFVGEETSARDGSGSREWIVDPIDGTLNYVRGIPLYGTQIALAVDGEPVMSVIYLPAQDELYTAIEEDGARLNGSPLRMPAEPRDLKSSIVAMCDFSRKSQRFREVQYRIIGSMYDRVARIKMFGAACVDMAMVASGRADMHFRYMNHIWDFLPGMFLCRCAGAYIHPGLLEKGFLLIASDEKLAQSFCDSVLGNIEV